MGSPEESMESSLMGVISNLPRTPKKG